MTWSWTWFSSKVRITLPTGFTVYWVNQTHRFHLVRGKLSSLFLVVATVTRLIWWLLTLIAWRIDMADHLDISPLTVPPVHQVWICLHNKSPLKRIAMSFHLFIWCCPSLISWLKTKPHATGITPMWLPAVYDYIHDAMIIGRAGEKGMLLYPSKKGFTPDKFGLKWNVWAIRISVSTQNVTYGKLLFSREPHLHAGSEIVCCCDSMIRFLEGRHFLKRPMARVRSLGEVGVWFVRSLLLCFRNYAESRQGSFSCMPRWII